MRKMIIAAVLFSSLFLSRLAVAGSPGYHFGAGLMALSSSTQQGGAGPSGSTLLMQYEFFHNWSWFGAGLFVLSDKQGSAEQDLAYGPKIELHWDVFYLDVGYALSAKRTYTDRSIAEETGTGMYYGIGTRFNLGAAGGGGGVGGGWYFFANYKFREYTIIKQDGVELSEKIIQKDSYPIFGLGRRF